MSKIRDMVFNSFEFKLKMIVTEKMQLCNNDLYFIDYFFVSMECKHSFCRVFFGLKMSCTQSERYFLKLKFLFMLLYVTIVPTLYVKNVI